MLEVKAKLIEVHLTQKNVMEVKAKFVKSHFHKDYVQYLVHWKRGIN